MAVKLDKPAHNKKLILGAMTYPEAKILSRYMLEKDDLKKPAHYTMNEDRLTKTFPQAVAIVEGILVAKSQNGEAELAPDSIKGIAYEITKELHGNGSLDFRKKINEASSLSNASKDKKTYLITSAALFAIGAAGTYFGNYINEGIAIVVGSVFGISTLLSSVFALQQRPKAEARDFVEKVNAVIEKNLNGAAKKE